MSSHDWFVEHRVDYATGTLDAADSATFEAHMAGCAECREEVSRIEEDLRWLPMNVEPVAPHPGLRRRIVAHVLEGSNASRRRWLAPAALAASLLLAVAGWYAGHRQIPRLESRVAQLQQQSAALRDTLSVIRAGRVLQADLEMDRQRGGLLIFADERTHRWSVVVHGLPPAPAGTAYQFWFVCSDGMVRGSRFTLAGEPPMMFTTGMPEKGGAVLGAALTVEPMDVDSGPPRGRELAHVKL